MHANLISDVESVNKDKYKKVGKYNKGESGKASIEA
mgnify:CR=1 FL=1